MSKLREIIRRVIKEETSMIDNEDFDFEAAYDAAPPKIKSLLDKVTEDYGYAELKILANKFKSLGYYLDYGLDAGITYFGPLKK
jgi:hypothetical protein